MQIRLLVACQERSAARALCQGLLGVPDARIAPDDTDLGGVLRRVSADRPDVLLLEDAGAAGEPVWNGLARLERFGSPTRTLALCDAHSPRSIVGLIQRGASGCLSSSSDPSLIAKAVVAVHQGELWFGRTALVEAVRSRMAAAPVKASVLQDTNLLTPRERQIMALVGAALNNKEIGRQLNISEKTVKTHLHHIYVKLHKSGRFKAFLSNVPATTDALEFEPPARLQ